MENIQKRNKRQNQWVKDNMQRIPLNVPMGMKDKIRAAADARGLSMTAFIKLAIDHEMDRG